MKLVKTIEVNNELGEGVIWDHARQKFWWTDIFGLRLYRYDPVKEALEQWQTPHKLACFAPVKGERYLIAAFDRGFAWYDPENGEHEWIAEIEGDNPGTRLNDGRTDRQGRFWAGTMVEDQDLASYRGSLYCLDSELKLHRHLGKLLITNSLCWSPDAHTMYHCDTPRQTIQAYPYDAVSGTPGEPRTIIETREGCFPDGSTIDAEGFLWNAQWNGSQVVRYAPDGREDLLLPVPTLQPTCAAFGGPDMNLLCVTSAWQGMSDSQRSEDGQAGNVFIYHTPYSAPPETPFHRTS